MGETRSSLRRAGSVTVLAAMLLSGCGDGESSSDDAANGNASEETSEDGSGTETSDGADDDQAESEDGAGGEDMSEDEDMDESTADAGEDVATLEVTIFDGEVNPPFDTYEVEFGEDVRIEITSDIADELHLHGYDLELELEPGEPGVLEFSADIEGRFELETHELGLQLLQLEVG